VTLDGFDWELYEERGLVVANFVITAAGHWRDENSSSRGISNDLDRSVLIKLRSFNKAVLTGGNTARIEGYRASAKFETFVLSTGKLPIPSGLTVISATSDTELQEHVIELKDRFDGLLVEAGPTLLSKLVSLDLIDRLFLTVVGEEHAPVQDLVDDSGFQGFRVLLHQTQNDTNFIVLAKPSSVSSLGVAQGLAPKAQ